MAHLALSFLGTFAVLLGDQPLVNFRSAKVQGLLIYLVRAQRQPQGRDALAALFWPDEPEATAKHNLRQSLYRLRGLLGDEDGQQRPFLLITRATAQFNPDSDHSLDEADFLAALQRGDFATAIARYQGDLVPGFSCDSLPLDDWLRSERERLHGLALDALFELTALSLTRGDFQNAQRLARRQLALESWREEAHRQLMEALALAGDRGGALAQYQTCCRVLQEELGIEPEATTQTLAARIRDQQVQPKTQAQTDFLRRLTTPFVGRHGEYEVLVQAYRRMSSGTLQAVTMVGNAGTGKTRLAQHFLAWVETQGADVLSGRSYETSAGLPYQPLTHLLRQRIERENAPEDLLSDLWLSQLTRLLPELRDRYPDLPEPTQDENTARQHLFEAITRLGQALAARRPLVLLVDDWHWADTASRDVLLYAAQRWAEAAQPILVLLTLRQEAITESPELQNWLSQLKRVVSGTQIMLSKLSQAETGQMMQALLSPEAGHDDAGGRTALAQFSDWLFVETDGQPLFIAEALKVLAEDGIIRHEPGNASQAGAAALSAARQTDWRLDVSRFDAQRAQSSLLVGFREIIQSWLARLSLPSIELLTAASVLAQAASFDNLCQVTGMDERQAVTVLEDLLNRQLLIETSPASTHTRDLTYSFSHQKVNDVIYDGTGAARRRMLHRRAFGVLREGAAAASDLAYHALHAGLVAETLRYSLVAGQEAMALFAVRVAIFHFETAWRIAEQDGWPQEASGADRQALYAGLGRAYELINEWGKAQEIYQAMIAYAQKIDAPAMECMGLNHLAMVHVVGRRSAEDHQKALVLLERAGSLAKQNGDQRAMAETSWNLAMIAWQDQKLDLALQHAEQALGIARSLQHPQLMARHLSILAYIYIVQRKWDKVDAYGVEASRLYEDAGNLLLAADSQRLVGFAQMLIGKPRESLATLQEMVAFSRQIENLWGEAECSWKLAYTHLELGDYGNAVKLARQALEQVQRVGLSMMSQLALCTWGTVQRGLMALEAARNTLLEGIIASPQEDVLEVIRDWALSELCALHALAGDWGQATQFARQRLQARTDDSLLPMGLVGWYETEALLRSGDGDLARAEVRRLGEIVGDNRRYQLILHRSQAVLAQWDGDLAQSIAHLEAALALAQEMCLPGEAWSIWGALGGLHAERGEQAKAQAAYREAAALIRRLAATMDEENLRVGFLAALPVQSILEKSEQF